MILSFSNIFRISSTWKPGSGLAENNAEGKTFRLEYSRTERWLREVRSPALGLIIMIFNSADTPVSCSSVDAWNYHHVTTVNR